VSLRALIGLVRLNLRRGRRGFALSALGVALGIASLVFFLALSAGVEQVVLGKVFPVGQLEIVPRTTSVSMFSFTDQPRPLDDKFAEALSQRREVERVFRRVKLAIPTRAWGGQSLFGHDLHTDLVAEGLDPLATRGDSLGPLPFAAPPDPSTLKTCNADADCGGGDLYCPWDTHRCETPVPAVISPFLIELYNTTIAKSHGLPQIGQLLASRFRGITFTIELGRSYIGGGGLNQLLGGGAAKTMLAEPHQRRVMLVGVSAAASRLALSLPFEYVRAWNRQYAGEAAGAELSAVVAILREGARTPPLAAFVRERGYEVADSGAERAGLAITLMTLLFSLVSLAILLVAAMNIAHSFFRAVAERRRELGLLRALGATRRDLAALLFTEAAALGVVGGVCGVAFARIAAFVIDLAARRFVPDFPFKPDSFFAFDVGVVAIGIGASLAACVLGAWLPARLAARVDPASALQGS
jgi:hypothetical protein